MPNDGVKCVYRSPQDGFVLVGSVAGQRYWSTFLSQDYVITAGTWTPDDQQVLNFLIC